MPTDEEGEDKGDIQTFARGWTEWNLVIKSTTTMFVVIYVIIREPTHSLGNH